jgi:tRNA threonylcarbamoyl adenosine modification protein YeaZ
MLTLLIETSTARGLLCLFNNHTLVFQEELPFGLNHSKLLIPKIQEGLKSLEMTASSIKQIGVGIGPGSYTGIRVGAMVAMTLAYSFKIPLVGISTLSCFVPSQDGRFAAVIDAKIGGVYLQTGIKEGENVEYTSPPRACSLAELGDLLKGSWNFVTPESRLIQPKLDALYPANEWKWEELPPHSLQMFRIVDEKVKEGEYTIDGSVELLYLRKTQAELEREIDRK